MSLPPKANLCRPRFISIEGNIGSGKSTILHIIRQNFPELTILDQPLSQWQNVGEHKNINLLGLYYNDPFRWGFTFQIYAFMSRINKWTEYSKMTGNNIRISERSLLSDRYIFASIMKDMNILDEAEHTIYLQFYEHLVRINNIIDVFGTIYVQCPAQTCAERVKLRSRQGEEGIPLDYLQKIHQKHEQWLNRNNENNSHVLVVDNSIPIHKQTLVKKISAWLDQKIKQSDQ